MFLSYFRAALRLFPGCCFDYIMIFAKRKECFSSFCIFVRFQQNNAGLSGFLSPRNAICIVKRNKKAGRIAPLSGLIRPAYLCCFRLTYAKFFDYNQCNLTPKVWECRTEGFQRAIADFVCSHCPLVAPAGAKSPARKLTSARRPPYSNKYPSITFKVLSAPSRWLRSYPCDAYTPAPISPWRMSYPARRVASTSDP